MDLDELFKEDFERLQSIPSIFGPEIIDLPPADELYLPGPTQPFRFEGDLPIYTTEQVDLYGYPEDWGVENYLVIEERETSHPMVTDYQMEVDRRGSLRPIHHYNRVERFQSILYQLLGSRGVVPRLVILTIQQEGYDPHPDRVWNSIRLLLKKHKWSLYYNRIPVILEQLGYKRKINVQDANAFVIDIVNQFKRISVRFERIKDQLERTYFPNLRYIVFKLLQENGAEFEYSIPFLRTPRKEKMMDELWLLLRNEVSPNKNE
jgi:hypothetical protein